MDEVLIEITETIDNVKIVVEETIDNVEIIISEAIKGDKGNPGITVSDTAPEDPSEGDLWLDTS
jgi:hypothetical protein